LVPGELDNSSTPQRLILRKTVPMIIDISYLKGLWLGLAIGAILGFFLGVLEYDEAQAIIGSNLVRHRYRPQNAETWHLSHDSEDFLFHNQALPQP